MRTVQFSAGEEINSNLSPVFYKIIAKCLRQGLVIRLRKMVLRAKRTDPGKKMERFLWRPAVTSRRRISGLAAVLTVYCPKMAAVAVAETSPSKDAIAEGLVDLLKPAIQQLDLHVHSVRYTWFLRSSLPIHIWWDLNPCCPRWVIMARWLVTLQYMAFTVFTFIHSLFFARIVFELYVKLCFFPRTNVFLFYFYFCRESQVELREHIDNLATGDVLITFSSSFL